MSIKNTKSGKGQVKYAVFASQLKKRYKIAPTRTLYNLHINKFDGIGKLHSNENRWNKTCKNQRKKNIKTLNI